MSQQHTARQSLELALEEYGLNEGPTQGPGLQQLARSSLKDQVGSTHIRGTLATTYPVAAAP